jgi:hypothetical protein
MPIKRPRVTVLTARPLRAGRLINEANITRTWTEIDDMPIPEAARKRRPSGASAALRRQVIEHDIKVVSRRRLSTRSPGHEKQQA